LRMMTTSISRTISVSIKRDPKVVYEFVLNLENFPRWARSTFQSIKQLNGNWVAETTQGSVTIDLTERNNFGILDHFVKLSSGEVILVLMRAIKNGEGSEVIFTLFQTVDMPDDKFAEDAKSVKQDLNILKNLVEEE
jgi:hypothetical protein